MQLLQSTKHKKINLDYLRQMASGDNVFMKEIINMFIHQTPANINLLYNYAVTQQWKEVKAVAHKMKSSIVLVGIQELEDIFSKLQHFAVSSEHTSLVEQLVLRAKTLCADAIEELKEELVYLGR